MPPRKNQQKSTQQVIPEYFKDNIQDPADEDFDPSQYYYKRPERSENQLATSQDPQLNFVTSGSTLPGEDDILQQGFSNPLTGVPQRFPTTVGGISLGTAVASQITRQPTPSSIIPNSLATGTNPRSMMSAMASQGNISPPLAQAFGSSALGSSQIQTPTTPTRPSPMRPGSANSNIISQQPVQLTSPLRPPSNLGNGATGSSILGLLNNSAMQQQQQMGAEYIPSNTILAMINKGPQQSMGGSLLSGNGLDNKFGSQQPFPQSQYQSLYRSQDMDLLSMPGQTASSKQYSASKTDDRYGLMGLLGVIKMVNPDLNTLSLGLDLTTLGLNLNSSEYLYTTFAAPWSDSPSRVVPEFKIPQCYQLPQQLPLKNAHFQKFQDETLFYIFYSMPKDVLQIVAAKELCARRWRYHKELKIWFKKDPDTQPQQQQAFERGPFVYFDVGLWSKCITKADFIIKREDTMTI